jgi:hypothetical protein
VSLVVFICSNPELILSGKRIETIAKALGMTVIVSERKGASPTATRPDRTQFYEMLEKSDVVVLCCPLDGSTRGMIGLAELKHMRKDAILVNVSRGGTVDEAAQPRRSRNTRLVLLQRMSLLWSRRVPRQVLSWRMAFQT